jgi:hypothetical protein
MKLKKLLILLFILGLVTLARETGVLKVELYRTTSTYKYNSKWHYTLSTMRLERRGYDTELPGNQLAGMPIAVVYKGDTLLHRKGDGGTAFVMRIHGIQAPSLWVPLYKSGSFNAVVSCSLDYEIIKVEGKYQVITELELEGDHVVKGSITITGLSSYKNSLNLVKMLIAKKSMETAKKYLISLDKRIAKE